MSGELYWLMKTEPETFSFEDLMKRPNQTESWDGVRNYTARNFMRNDFKVGQSVFIYHSRVDEPAIVGIAKVVKAAHPDPTALDPKSDYFDEKSLKAGESRWCMVSVKAAAKLKRPVTLKELKANKHKVLKDLPLTKAGQRLSIQPVTPEQWRYILSLTDVEEL